MFMDHQMNTTTENVCINFENWKRRRTENRQNFLPKKFLIFRLTRYKIIVKKL